MVVEKADARVPSTNFELQDIHQNFDSTKLVQTTLGGYMQQLYFVVCSIMDCFGDDLSSFYQRKAQHPSDKESNKAATARELLVE